MSSRRAPPKLLTADAVVAEDPGRYRSWRTDVIATLTTIGV
ncbi:hypothetical protein [Kribbella sp. NPDC050459]